MDIIEVIKGMYAPVIIVACLVVGFVVKKWIKDVDNKWIPTIVTILGAVLGFIINGASIGAVVAGAVSGLASTGFHQLFKQLIENGGKVDDSRDNTNITV